MKTRLSILNGLVVAAVAIGMSAALNRVQAADAPSWLTKTQQRLAAAVDTKVAGITEVASAKAIPTLLEAARIVATTRSGSAVSTLLR